MMLYGWEGMSSPTWCEVAANGMSRSGMRAMVDGRTVLVHGEAKSECGVAYSDSWRLSATWIAPRRHMIGITSQRMYYLPNGQRDRRPEHVIVSGRRPAGRSIETELEHQCDVIAHAQRALGCAGAPLLDGEVLANCDATARRIRIGTQEAVVPSAALDRMYRQYGYDDTPNEGRLSVCGLDGVTPEAVRALASHVEKVLHARNALVSVVPLGAERVKARLNQMDKSSSPLNGRAVLFMLPRRDAAVTPAALELMRQCEDRGVPFRRAYANEPHRFAVPNQAPSLLTALGGRPHRIAGVTAEQGIWSVGVDLAHPPGASMSRVTVTLVDPGGCCVGAWTKMQVRNESIHPDVLRVLLCACWAHVSENVSEVRMLIVRDGRLFEGESPEVYRSVLKCPHSLVEYRKYGNPVLVERTEAGKYMACAPAAMRIAGTNTVFLTTSPVSDTSALPHPAKVTWRSEWNGLSLTAAEIAGALIGLSAAPTLAARHASLPSPLYWADGLAAASDADLRFRGQRIHHMA